MLEKEIRTVLYDEELKLEAYCFEGIAQSFPNHFHDYYVIGYIEAGARSLSCKNREYIIKPGDILLFNPNDNHGCTQSGDEKFDYRGININAETMISLSEEITGNRGMLSFSQNVITDEELRVYLKSLHRMIMSEDERLEKEEMFLIFMSRLIERYGQASEKNISECHDEIEAACLFMEQHYTERISLEQLCKCSKLSKSALLRAFTKLKGITPYRYLQSIRICRAKSMLENGASPVDAALQTGFADQSHFTNFFHMYTGLSPAAYRRIFREKHGDEENDK